MGCSFTYETHSHRAGANQKYNKKGQLPFDLASQGTLSRLCDLLGEERFSRLRDDILDTQKSVKPAVPFYNRKKKVKKSEAGVLCGDGPQDVQES